MPKETVSSLKQQNQDIKDKVDVLSKEIAQLKEEIHVDWAITSGAEATSTSEIAIIMLRMMRPCLEVYNT